MIQFRNTKVVLNGQPVLRGLDWSLNQGEHWAVLGANGSGKSTFLKLTAGLLTASSDSSCVYSFFGPPTPSAMEARKAVALVSPERHEKYQRSEYPGTALEIVLAGLFGTDFLYQRVGSGERARARELAEHFGLSPLLDRHPATLSQGELARILLLQAVFRKPRVLAFDEFSDGLDRRAKADIFDFLIRLVRDFSPSLLYAVHRRDRLFERVTHVLQLEKGRVRFCGRREDFERIEPPRPRPDRARLSKESKRVPVSDRPLFWCEDATVYRGRQPVLKNLTWRIEPGQQWVVAGPNGSGKSTLLKMIWGEEHPAAGGVVGRFGHSGVENLWNLRRGIGWVSSEMQAAMDSAQPALWAVASGLKPSLGLLTEPSVAEAREARRVMRRFGVESLAARPMGRLSNGQRRRVMIARAMIGKPHLLLLDEALDGLDDDARHHMAYLLEALAEAGVSMVLISHHPEELPQCMTHCLELMDGKSVYQGLLSTWLDRVEG